MNNHYPSFIIKTGDLEAHVYSQDALANTIYLGNKKIYTFYGKDLPNSNYVEYGDWQEKILSFYGSMTNEKYFLMAPYTMDHFVWPENSITSKIGFANEFEQTKSINVE